MYEIKVISDESILELKNEMTTSGVFDSVKSINVSLQVQNDVWIITNEGTDLSKLHHRRKDFEKYDIQGKGDTVVLVEGENDALHLDINKLPLALLGISEPVTMVNIKSLIRLLLNQYLPEFADAHCHFHLTSSCGWKETQTISCRLSFVLTNPLTNAALKNLYLSINERAQFKLLAPAVCSASQPIFTANPIITPPAVTPFNIRSGNLYGDNEFLDLDILMLKKIRL